ncbi:MAG: BLUF domain-containing protein [Alphaproteobacteria bacterium]|nr:BLUF domain-containing protein [Alphaproteobacteria bacterium]
MSVYRVVYSSRPFGFDSAILSSILVDARRMNARDDITGALICRGYVYLQLLEGPEGQVKQTLERINRDDRHVEVTLHVAESVSERMFAEWAMLHDPAASWIWSMEDISEGAVERTTPEEVMTIFKQLRELPHQDHVE